MPSVLRSNGRVVVASPDYYRQLQQRRNDAVFFDTLQSGSEEQRAAESEAANNARKAEQKPDLGALWKDPDDGVNYRVVTTLDLSDGWVTIATMMRWFSVPRSTVIQWVKNGWIDAAFEQHSPTKRYRLLNHHEVRKDVEALLKAAREERNRR